jgi:hypothetical protein
MKRPTRSAAAPRHCPRRRCKPMAALPMPVNTTSSGARLYQTAPISTNLILGYIGQRERNPSTLAEIILFVDLVLPPNRQDKSRLSPCGGTTNRAAQGAPRIGLRISWSSDCSGSQVRQYRLHRRYRRDPVEQCRHRRLRCRRPGAQRCVDRTSQTHEKTPVSWRRRPPSPRQSPPPSS